MTPVRDSKHPLNLFHRHNLEDKEVLRRKYSWHGIVWTSSTKERWQFEITITEHYHLNTVQRPLSGCTCIDITHKVNLHTCVYATQETAHFRVQTENFSNCNTHNGSHDVWETKQTIRLTFFILTRWLYRNTLHRRMISSHSSTTYCIYYSLRITWRTRSVQQIAQSMCLVQLIP